MRGQACVHAARYCMNARTSVCACSQCENVQGGACLHMCMYVSARTRFCACLFCACGRHADILASMRVGMRGHIHARKHMQELCMLTRMLTCACMCIPVHMCMHLCVLMHEYVCMQRQCEHPRMQALMHASTHPCEHACMRTRMHGSTLYMHAVPACAHTHMHVCIHVLVVVHLKRQLSFIWVCIACVHPRVSSFTDAHFCTRACSM
mmetsp:Transcript_1620/g.4363  ORF Transcript_1620/g.4363 Transcript_1620/m.4363 type:complete len:207 (+) Transcript_1620:1114-1734(+)